MIVTCVILFANEIASDFLAFLEVIILRFNSPYRGPLMLKGAPQAFAEAAVDKINIGLTQISIKQLLNKNVQSASKIVSQTIVSYSLVHLTVLFDKILPNLSAALGIRNLSTYILGTRDLLNRDLALVSLRNSLQTILLQPSYNYWLQASYDFK